MKPIKAWAVMGPDDKIGTKFKVHGGAVWCDTPTEMMIYRSRAAAKRHGAPWKIVRIQIKPVR